MSAALVNRSLTTVRTELEFLKDSEVITEALYDKLVAALPTKYKKDEKPWDVDALQNNADSTSSNYTNGNSYNSTEKFTVGAVKVATEQQKLPPSNPDTEPAPSYNDKVNQISESLSKANLKPPAYPPSDPSPVGYCMASYDYKAQEPDDISLTKGDKIAVTEHLSEDWWKGYKAGTGRDKAGVFPSNYVKVISEQEFKFSHKEAAAPPSPNPYSSYGPPAPYGQPSPYNQPSPMPQQPSYGGGYGFPPPQQYQQQYQVAPQAAPQQVQQVQQQPSGRNEAFKKYGSRFGEAALFGAGASVGANIVNSIL